MKRVVLLAWLVLGASVAYGQPTPVPGLKTVTTDASLTGSGTVASPLKIRTCSDGYGLVYSTGSGTWVCTSASGVTGSGTTNTLAKWTSASGLGNSLLTDSATTLAYNTNKFTVTASNGNTAVAGTLDATGLVTATAGVTTPANLTTTGTGDLVSADDLVVADRMTMSSTRVLYPGAGDAFETTNEIRIVGTGAGGTSLFGCLNTTSALGNCIATDVTGDAVNRFVMRVDGNMFWGGGAGATDIDLKRDAAGSLAISGTNVGIGQQLTINSATPTISIPGTTSALRLLGVGNSPAQLWLQLTGQTAYLALGTTSANATQISAFSSDSPFVRTININPDGGTINLGATSSAVVVNAGLTRFNGTSSADPYFSSNTLNASYSTNGTDTLYLNFYGYLAGTTQFRNLGIYDGKNNQVAYFTGSSKAVEFNGAVTADSTVDVAGVFDVNNDLAKFGATDGNVYISGLAIDFAHTVNSTATGYINYHGYNAGTTQFRDLVIADGKGATACTFTGSSKLLNCVGGLQENGSPVQSGSLSNTYLPKSDGTNLVNSTISDNGYIDIARDLVLTGAGTAGQMYINADQINFQYNVNANAAGYINQNGYGLGTTQFRDLIIADGKNAQLMMVDGSAARVGIGPDTTPDYFFDVQGELNADYITPDTKLFDHTRGYEIYEEFMSGPCKDMIDATYASTHCDNGAFTFDGGYDAPYAEAGGNHPGVITLRARTSAITIGCPSGTCAAPRFARFVQGWWDGAQATGDVWYAGGGTTKVAALFQIIGVLSPPVDDSDSYTFHVGLYDNNVANGATADYPPNGIYCRIGSASSNIQVCTSEADTQSCTDTSPAISIAEDKWIRCEFTVNAAGTQVDFTVTNVTDSTSGTASRTTNIPNDTSHTVGLGATLDSIDSNGEGAVIIDYVWMDQTFTTAR